MRIFILILVTAFLASAEKKHPQYRNTPELIELCLIYKDQPVFPQLCEVLFDSLKKKPIHYQVTSVMLYKDKKNILKDVEYRLEEPQIHGILSSDFFIDFSHDSIIFQTLFPSQKISFQFTLKSIKEIQNAYCKTKNRINESIRPFKEDSLKHKSLFRVYLDISNKDSMTTAEWKRYFNTLGLLYLTNRFILRDIARRKYGIALEDLDVYQKNGVMNLSVFLVMLVFL